MTLFKSVFKSVFNRRDVKIYLSFILLPILVPLLSDFMDGMSADMMKNFLSFLDSAVSTQSRLILPILLLSLVISSVFKDEIDSGIMFLYKDINRVKIFNAKLFSLISIYSIFLMGTVLLSLLSYYVMLLPQGNVTASFVSENTTELISTLFSLVSTIGLNLITIALVVMVSVTAKTIQSALTGVFFSLASTVAPLLIGIKYLFPNGYAQMSQANLLLACVISTTISILYFSVFYIKGKNRFKKVEF